MIARETGGRAIEIRTQENLDKALGQISKELRSQYMIGCYPTNTKHDGTFRKIKVKVTSAHAKVLAPTGYYAPPGWSFWRAVGIVQSEKALVFREDLTQGFFKYFHQSADNCETAQVNVISGMPVKESRTVIWRGRTLDYLDSLSLLSPPFMDFVPWMARGCPCNSFPPSTGAV
jgi:hypothetical protein